LTVKNPPRAALLAGSSVWCLAIIAAPLAKLGLIYALFSIVCHQDPARSWAFSGTPLPVCIRCASIYFGFFASLWLAFPLNVKWLRVSIILTIAEFTFAQLVVDTSVLRSLSGILLGAAAAPFIMEGVRQMGGIRARV
jgi:uncharacterized membrane protein